MGIFGERLHDFQVPDGLVGDIRWFSSHPIVKYRLIRILRHPIFICTNYRLIRLRDFQVPDGPLGDIRWIPGHTMVKIRWILGHTMVKCRNPEVNPSKYDKVPK